MIEKLIQELIEALKANTEALKASSQPVPAPPSSMTTSQGSEMVTHDMAVITYSPEVSEPPKIVTYDETDTEAIQPPKRRGRPPKSAAPVEQTPMVLVKPEGAALTITSEPQDVVVEPPKPAVTLEQVRNMGQKLLDLTGDATPIRTYVNERGCKALRELKPEQWAEAYEWLSQKVAALQP